MSNHFYKVSSSYKYYNYLSKYTPAQLLKYQSGDYYYLGRRYYYLWNNVRGAWKNLVNKFGGDMISLEEEHSMKYKTHLFLMNVSYRAGWFLFVYMCVYGTFFLGDIGAMFTFSQENNLIEANPDDEEICRYETLYIKDKP